jgi:DNA-binding LytR/AlgR family response regulator
MKINTLVVDDTPEWRDILGRLVKMNPLLNLVAVCESALEAYDYIANASIQLVICNIEMAPISGLDFIKNLDNSPLVIFVTAHQGYALDCYEVSPLDFLVKPIEPVRFFKSVEKARKRLTETTEAVDPYFYVWENKTYVQVLYRDVHYIKAEGNFVQIFTSSQMFMSAGTITKIEEKLKPNIFLRVHRSFLVNRNAIAKVGKNEVVLRIGQEIPIGEQYRNKINQKEIEAYAVLRN